MKSEPSEQLISISIAICAAICLHILIVLAITHLLPQPTDKEYRTVPTVTISKGSRASIAMQQAQSKSTNSAAANAYLASLEASTFTAQERNKQKRHTSKAGNTNNPPQNELLAPEFPSRNTNKQSQTSRAKRANQGMVNIFKKQKTTAQVQQISTKQHKELTDYEISLRSILSRAVFYDQFHKFIEAKGKNNKEVNFEVTLILLPNGAIKNAKITRSSGIKEIDILAKQNAYKASPYPRPPAKDMQKGFRYSIAITHQQISNDN